MKRNASILGSVCLIVFGLILLANPDFGSAVVSNIIGWLLVILGGLACVYGVLHAGAVWTILSGLVVVIGIVLLWNPLLLARILGILLGLYLAFLGFGALRTALKLKKTAYHYGANLVVAILLLVFGLVLLFLPLTTSRLLMTLAGLVMTACGIINLIVRARADKLLQEGDDSKIVDADP